MIPLFKVNMSEEASRAAARVLRSGYVGQGEEAEKFESELAGYMPAGMRPVLTNSCTSAIHMVLRYLGIGPGDEVITTPLTCVATNAPILDVGARPVWADVSSWTGNISPESVGKKITKRAKAIIAVDWTGRPAEYETLKSFGLPVIQDAAHSPLCRGEHGDFICFSYGPIKHLTCGDGGAVACKSERDAQALRKLRWYGLDRNSTRDFRCQQDIVEPGMKWHMNDVNAAIGRANLPYLERTVEKHYSNAAHLQKHINHYLVHTTSLTWESNYWVLPLIIRHPDSPDYTHQARLRDAFKEWMELNGVACSKVHARNDKHTGYNFPSGDLPGLDNFDSWQVNIPCGWWLTQDDLDVIVEAVNSFKP